MPDKHEWVLLVVDSSRTYDFQVVPERTERHRTNGNLAIFAVLRLLDEEDAFGEVDIADLERPHLSRPECRRVCEFEDRLPTNGQWVSPF